MARYLHSSPLVHVGDWSTAARRRFAPVVAALAAGAFLAAAPLLPRDARAGACLDVSVASLAPAVESAEVIVVGTVVEVNDRQRVVIRPEAYLDGPAEAADILLQWPSPVPRCPLAEFAVGERVLIFLDQGPGGLDWPGAGDTFALRDGTATGGAPPVAVPEVDLVERVRAITGQYAVPSEVGGAGLDLVGTVIPVVAVVLGLFAIGLVLMRTWHRIDPS